MYGLNYLDEGFVINSMNRLLNGEVPYRDFFTLLTPGFFYFGAILLKIFGNSIETLRFLMVFFGSLLSLLVFKILFYITKNLFLSGLGWIVSVFFGLSLGLISPSYSWNSVLLAIISMIFLFDFVKNGKSNSGYFSGLFLFLAGFFKQSIGFYAFVAYLIILVYLYFSFNKEKTVSFIKKFVLVLLSLSFVYLSFFVYTGAFSDMYTYILKFPLTVFSEARLYPPSIYQLKNIFFDFRVENLSPYLFYFQLLVLITSFVLILRNFYRRKVDSYLFILFVFSAFIFLHNFERYSFLKVRTTLPLLIVLFFYLIWKLINFKRDYRKIIIVSLVFCVVALSSASYYLREKYFKYLNYDSEFLQIDGLLVNVNTNIKYDKLIDDINLFIQKDELLFIYPMNPMLYSLLGRQNPTRFDLVIPGNFDENILDEIIETLEIRNVKYLVYDEPHYMDDKKFEDYAKKLNDYIRAHFHVYKSFPEYEGAVIYIRNDVIVNY